jgi:predicted RNA-binding Zn-ribbon protein involved in translation (DUF1610 family)
MGNREEPAYQVFDYICPHCGAQYREANSVRKHPDYQICPVCGKSGLEKKTIDDQRIYRVLRQLRVDGINCFLPGDITTEGLDASVKGWG